MATSNAATVEAYIAELPAERREVVSKVRELVRRNLPKGYKRAGKKMDWENRVFASRRLTISPSTPSRT